MQLRPTSSFLRFFVAVLLLISLTSRAIATEWVPVEGRVMFDGAPLCAMVLANGQNIFSCSGDGSYQLSVPLDGNGEITLYSFASGFAPFKRVLTLQQATNFMVDMVREADGRILAVSKVVSESNKNDWAVISGTVSYENEAVCGLILANGQHMFSCGENQGKFRIEVPLDGNGDITLFAFAEGFQPYKEILIGVPQYLGVSQTLNDTGETYCSDEISSRLSCPVPGYPGQDAEYGRDVTHNDDSDGKAGFSFTKLDADGKPLSASAVNWSCVKDNVTELVWEVKTTSGLRDYTNYYTWFNPDQYSNGGNPGEVGEPYSWCSGGINCDTYSYVQAVNAQNLCGASDWRMPNSVELRSLLNYGDLPQYDTVYFPNSLKSVNALSNGYWSGSTYVGNRNYALITNLSYGIGHRGMRTDAKWEEYRVRLVRGGL